MIPRMFNPPKENSFFLFGPRQTGKSTLISETFSQTNTIRYNLLRQTDLVRLQTKPDVLLLDCLQRPPQKTHLVIDEIQKLPELLDVVQAILMEPNPPIFVLSGSSARKLKRQGANLLAGRVWTRNLHPFTHLELGSEFDLERAFHRGTLPPMYLARDQNEAAENLNAYVATYLTEEIQQEAKIRSIGPFSRFLLQAAGGLGEAINYSSIARQTMTSDKTVREYFQILEDTLLGFFLLAYGKSRRKRLSRHPKFYLFDPGVALAVQGLERSAPMPGTRLWGELFELWVINEIRHLLSYAQMSGAQMSYLRTEGGAEVDLILEHPGKPTLAIEIKSMADVPYGAVRPGFELARELIPEAKCHVICTSSHHRQHEGTEFWPWREFFQWWIGEWQLKLP